MKVKTILFLTCVLLALTNGIAVAQLSGKKFISGSASLNFASTKPEVQNATNNYGFGFDISMGRFSSENRASGWKISTALGGAKEIFLATELPVAKEYEKSGIRSFQLGGGHFWHFYKHFNEKTGVFAGPEVNLSYQYASQFSYSASSGVFRDKSNRVILSGGISVGMFYRFSKKWWITGTVGFSTPVSVDYTLLSTGEIEGSANSVKERQLNYRFSPTIASPTLGFGLRYFPGR